MANTVATYDGTNAITIDGSASLEWSSGDAVVWTIAIDLNDDGDFSDSNEDLSSDVISFSWQLGGTKAYEVIASAATCDIVLRNDTKKYSPENASSPIYGNFTRSKVIRIQSTYASTTTTHFIGRIASIKPTPNTVANRVTNVRCDGFLREVQDTSVSVPVQENKTADQVIEEILVRSGLNPPGLSGRWLLNVTGFGELGQNTTLGNITDILSAETGKTTFSIIGDNWRDETSVYGALRDVTGQEAGRLFVDRNGVINFWNRHHLPSKVVPDSTVPEASISGMDYSFGDVVINSVTVGAHTRNIASNIGVLGRMNKAVSLSPGEEKTINIKYESDEGVKISGKNVVVPQKTTDYQAFDDEDGNGAEYTNSVTAKLVGDSSTEATIKFTNNAPVKVWIQAGATVQGIKITDYGKVDATAVDNSSIGSYQKHSFTYSFSLDDFDIAESMAKYFLNLWKDPVGRINSVTLRAYQSDKTLSQAINRTIGDRIEIVETQTSASGDYFIIGEQFNFAGPRKLDVTWHLEPADPQQYFIIGRVGSGELGQKTKIGPF